MRTMPIENDCEDQIHVPKWLNEKQFDGCLRELMPSFEKTLSFTVKPTANAAEVRIRLEIKLKGGSTKAVAFLLKIPTLDRPYRATHKEVVGFEKESFVYQELVPAFQLYFKDAGKEGFKFCAQSYKIKPNVPIKTAYVLLEDLQSNGYRRGNLLLGLNIKHTQAVLEKLAAFHAASVVHFSTKRDRKVPESLTQPLVTAKDREKYRQDNELSDRVFQESLRSYGLRQFERKIKSYQSNFFELLLKMEEIDQNEFSVLLHGSLSTQNILFQYDAFGDIKDVALVNFQSSQFGSPAKDLLHFLLTSVCLSDMIKNFEVYIKYYSDHLASNLKLLKYPQVTPKLTSLYLDLLKYSGLGFMAISKSLPQLLFELPWKENFEMENFLHGETKERKILALMYGNPSYAAHVSQVLPWMELRGYLEE